MEELRVGIAYQLINYRPCDLSKPLTGVVIDARHAYSLVKYYRGKKYLLTLQQPSMVIQISKKKYEQDECLLSHPYLSVPNSIRIMEGAI